MEKNKLNPICFVIMPFHQKNDEVFNLIIEATDSCGIKSVRADRLEGSSSIDTEQIKKLIRTSYYVIVDISGLDAKVLYELGMAHILREEIKNILIIKDNSTYCSSELQLTYKEYNISEPSNFITCIKEFIKADSFKNNLKNLLLSFDLINAKDSVDEILEDIKKNYTTEKIDSLICVLNSDFRKIKEEEMNGLLVDLTKSELNSSFNIFYANLLDYLTSKIIDNGCDIKRFIDYIFEDQQDIKLRTQIAILILGKNIEIMNLKYTSILTWISNYLSGYGTTEIEVNKLKIQATILENNTHSIEDYLTNKIDEYLVEVQAPRATPESDFKKENLLAEHFLLLCSSKQIGRPNSILKIIEIIKDPYVVKSAIDLLESLVNHEKVDRNVLKTMFDVLNTRSDFVNRFDFLQERIKKLKSYM